MIGERVMKKLAYILLLIVFLVPFKVRALSCLKNNYEATIEISNDRLRSKEKAYLNVTSSSFYNLEYELSKDNIISITNEGIIEALNSGEVNLIVSVNFLEDKEIVEQCRAEIPITVISSNITLKSLTLREYDLKDVFKSDVYNYEITLPYKVETINIDAVPTDDDAQVLGTGEKALSVGLNEFEITVSSYAEEKTYTLSVFRSEASDNAQLKSLTVSGYLLEPKFSKDTHNYTLEVPKDIDKIKIKAEAYDKNAQVKGTGSFNLTTGKNNFTITVTAENGSTSKYKIEINKNKGSSTLNNLSVEGYSLEETFTKENYLYHLTVPPKVEKIKIKASANPSDQIEIFDNDHLNYGQNEILIRVTSQDKTTTTYKIIVNRLAKNQINYTVIQTILFIVFVIAIIITISLITIFIIKNKKPDKKIKKIDFRK